MKLRKFLLLLPLSLLAISFANGQVRLPKMVTDGMVLQRDTDLMIWGWAGKKEQLSVSFSGNTYSTTADESGEWSVNVGSLKPGGPFSMTISGEEDSIQLNDIYIGDVWLASGQSNMETTMDRVSPRFPGLIEKASNQEIRFFEVPKTYDFSGPQKDLEQGIWKPVTPSNVRQFSAVAYFFAENLYQQYQVPIGIINSALGGSPIEAWISLEALKPFPQAYAEAQQYNNPAFIDSIQQADATRISGWYSESQRKDLGSTQKWKDPGTDVSSWSTMEIPGYWADTDLGPTTGVVWFRKDISLPTQWEDKAADLNLGVIVDADSVFVNGHFVGNTSYQYPPRRYKVPEGILKEGQNSIIVRVISERGRGGFVSDKDYELISETGSVDLEGAWKFNLGSSMPPLQGQTFIRFKPSGLYNAMIHPLKDFPLKGVIWYQGESNTDQPDQYQSLFPTMIHNWRTLWENDSLPFIFVQLANFMPAQDEPTDSQWARLREAQLNTLEVPHTAMAVAIDVGEWNDIHPLDKKSVGDRLARGAKAVAYNEDIVPSGPLYESYQIVGDSIEISFSNVATGLVARDGDTLKHFAIAGPDRKFHWARAVIRGDKVIVSHPQVKNPLVVRYAWADNPDSANLYNEEGLPASPFRTDDWE